MKLLIENFHTVIRYYSPLPLGSSTLSHSSSYSARQMDLTPTSRRNLKSPKKSDIYSTFVVRGEISDSDKEKHHDDEEEQPDIYATMIYKKNDDDDDVGVEEEEEEDDSALPPLLKRLPKDFGGGSSIDYDNDPSAEDYGTMIVRTNRSSRSSVRKHRDDLDYSDFNSSLKKRIETFEDDEDENDGGFSTFVVEKGGSDDESVSGTVVRKTSGGGGGSSGGFRDSTMGMAVASMQAVGELGFGGRQQRKESGSSSQGEDIRGQHSKISSSSMPDSVTKEDPTSKYELLSELGLFNAYNQY